MKKAWGLGLLIGCSWALLGATLHEHALYDSVSLDGTWEMAYQPYAWETVDYPSFTGVPIAKAVPGYWEDMVPTFRAAGMKDEFRINPLYEKQTFPITGWASDTTLPNIYGCFFYRRTVVLDKTGPAVLAFEGVRNQVHAWINGKFVAFRAGFSTPFELAIPEGVLKQGVNEIVLAVSNNPNLGYGDYVSGLTTRSTFRSTGGVNGHLELRFVKGDIGDVYVTTARDLKTFTVHVTGKTPFGFTISDGDRTLAQGKATGDFTLPTDGYAFWSPDSPKRYTLTLATPEGSYRQKFGLRRLVADGEKFRLNGKPIYLRGVTEHCYFAKTVHLPRDLDYYRMITAKRKELGFNFVRFHTFVPPEEFLEATDELGMLVHVETPNFIAEPEFAAVVAFARRHPSVVIYCMGNEWRIDRLAEAYLRDCAEIVHTGTDSLFTPVSAMRGVEYHIVDGKDAVAERPYLHNPEQPFRYNPERMARLAEYCDLFTSYQLGTMSYDSLNVGTPATLDEWGDVYCGKPRLSHEICIDGSYADLGLEKLYPQNSPILKSGMFQGLRRHFEERGVIDRVDTYFVNSCEWMRRIRKHAFEKIRLAGRMQGYDFLGDYNNHWHTFGYSVGMMDEFFRLKPTETVENVRRYNSAAVLLSDLGSDFVVRAGEAKRVAFSVSNYDDDAPGSRLTAELRDEAGRVVAAIAADTGDVPNGRLASLGAFDFAVPKSDLPRNYVLRARFEGGGVKASNEWEIHAFPKAAAGAAVGVRVVEDISERALADAMARGERVVLLGAGPFRSLPTTYRIGIAGRCSGNYATVIKKDHPALEGLPHAGFCGWQFRRLMQGGAAVQLEAGVPFDPIIDIASSVKRVIRQALLFEYRIGRGRLLVCSLKFGEDDPAAQWLRARLVDYAASDKFDPALSLTPAQLHAVVSAPLLTGSADRNRARNPHDPASAVRAGRFAQP
jgi:hypothetical protein